MTSYVNGDGLSQNIPIDRHPGSDYATAGVSAKRASIILKHCQFKSSQVHVLGFVLPSWISISHHLNLLDGFANFLVFSTAKFDLQGVQVFLEILDLFGPPFSRSAELA